MWGNIIILVRGFPINGHPMAITDLLIKPRSITATWPAKGPALGAWHGFPPSEGWLRPEMLNRKRPAICEDFPGWLTCSQGTQLGKLPLVKRPNGQRTKDEPFPILTSQSRRFRCARWVSGAHFRVLSLCNSSSHTSPSPGCDLRLRLDNSSLQRFVFGFGVPQAAPTEGLGPWSMAPSLIIRFQGPLGSAWVPQNGGDPVGFPFNQPRIVKRVPRRKKKEPV